MKNKHRTHSLVAALVASGLAVGCTDTTQPSPVAEQEQPAAPQDANRISIPATVRANLGMTFASVERRQVETTVRLPGVFELQPRARRDYTLSLAGTVDLLVDQHQAVRSGDPLYRLRSSAWLAIQEELIEAEQAIPAAMAAVEVARASVEEVMARIAATQQRRDALESAGVRNAELEERLGELRASVPRLEASLRQAEFARAATESTLVHAAHHASAASGIPQARLMEFDTDGLPLYRNMDEFEVAAAADGVVESLATTDGAFAEASAIVLTTIDPSKVRFRARAPQADMALFASIADARIVPPGQGAAAASDSLPVTVTIGLEAQPEARTIDVFAAPVTGSDAESTLRGPSRAWVRPGVSAFLEVVTDGSAAPMLAIPRAAVVRDGLRHVFFRRDPSDPNVAIRVEADLGPDDGQWVAISSGLSPNDIVVVDGAYELMLASALGGTQQQGGHFHADGTFHGEPD
ncbi:MAG: efflux RND transporter periplasmic adaptor subunit [Planctomycetota bacterium]|nr:efflux RND transporter periplasmic adaptor subunit [Planctomycetota bacterium]MDA1106682.1 efflux RND transporter periplasmic adaptor subunit [Planctomycetota bacterium]